MKGGQPTYIALGKAMVMAILFLFAFAKDGNGQSGSFLFEIRSPAYKGSLLYESGNFAASIPLLEQALSRGKHKGNALLREKLANAYAITGKSASGAHIYKALLEEGAELEKGQALQYANSLMASGQLEEGRRILVHYLTVTEQEANAKKVRELSISELFRDSIRYSVLPASFNTEAAEFSPVVTSSGVIFVSDRAKAGLVKNRFSVDESSGLDLFYGPVDKEGNIQQVVRMSGTINTNMFEGPGVISGNGKDLFFTRSGSNGEMKLYQASSILSHSSWGNIQPVKLPVSGSAGHPALAQDGKVIYFVSDMPGGYGGTDIYKIEKNDIGWLAPVNLGPRVNTAGNEMFPTLSDHNKLYFSSNGHMGLGGLDIFVALLAADSVVEVRNVGAPVNSPADDFGLSLHQSGDWGFFSSNRAGGAGKDDLYKLKINRVTLAGKLIDKTNQQGISNAIVKLYQENILLQEAQTDKEGNYLFKLFPGQEYELKFLAEDYRGFEEILSTRQGQRSGIRKFERGLDRKVKMFVLGTIRNSDQAKASGSTIYAIDQFSGRIDTAQADHRGNYEMELDVRSQYTFWAVCGEEASVSTFSTPEKGKASLSYYENMKLKPFLTYQVKGMIKIPPDRQGPVIISRFNELTQETDFLFTDENGFFSFEANNLTRYELCLPQGEGSNPLILSSGWGGSVRTVELSW